MLGIWPTVLERAKNEYFRGSNLCTWKIRIYFSLKTLKKVFKAEHSTSARTTHCKFFTSEKSNTRMR
jgi:hypothetical protein